MKIVIAFLMAVLASVSGFSQEERPVNPVRILTAGQHIIPYKIEVTFGKTVHILFPSEVRYVDLGSNNIIADRKSTRLNSSHPNPSRMPSSA